VVYETAMGAIRGPCLEDMLLLAAGNLGQTCFAERYKLAVDAACLFLRERLDLNTVASRAREWHVTIPLWGLLRLVAERLHAPVPDRLLQQVAPVRLLGGMVERLVGARRAPWHPDSSIKLTLAAWPLTGRALWPLAATGRWARLRILDLLQSHRAESRTPRKSA
jgi:hypothetical protein